MPTSGIQLRDQSRCVENALTRPLGAARQAGAPWRRMISASLARSGRPLAARTDHLGSPRGHCHFRLDPQVHRFIITLLDAKLREVVYWPCQHGSVPSHDDRPLDEFRMFCHYAG